MADGEKTAALVKSAETTGQAATNRREREEAIFARAERIAALRLTRILTADGALSLAPAKTRTFR